MNYSSITSLALWTLYSGQTSKNVTYIWVLNRTVPRLVDCSDILYIGATQQPISKRFTQETRTASGGGNTQGTNIRLTHVLSQLGVQNCKLYFTSQVLCPVIQQSPFFANLQIWDKKNFLAFAQHNPASVSLEKYLLVMYAADHFEVPPLNNRV